MGESDRRRRLEFHHPRRGRFGANVLRMVRAWSLLGVLLGGWGGLVQGAPRAIIAGAIAGLVVLPPLGAILGLIGGRARESLLGGGIGLVIWLAAGTIAGEVGRVPRADLGIMVGALVGATCWPYIRMVSWSVSRLSARVALSRGESGGHGRTA